MGRTRASEVATVATLSLILFVGGSAVAVAAELTGWWRWRKAVRS
jgi:hypothetical protein